MTRILLAEDHAIVRQGFRALLEAEEDFTVVAETGDGREAVQLVQTLQPDVLVVDLMLPGLNGLDVTRQVTEHCPKTRVILLSMYASEPYVLEALRCGAAAYVLKESGADELKRAVRAVVRGHRYLAPPLSDRAIDAFVFRTAATSDDSLAALTTREREVFQHTIQGLSSRTIADRLNISPRTVEKHRDNLMRKLDLHSRDELLRFAMRHGLLPPTSPDTLT